jgi:23S rRNA (adenine2503-C2)-methyltransferase
MLSSFFDFDTEQLKSWMLQKGAKPFNAQQLQGWVYGRSVIDWEKMTNLSKSLRNSLKQEMQLPGLTLLRVQPSSDLETFKFLWKLSDGYLVESVLICSGTRRTVCVSSQVGCPAKCAFCASGKEGFFRNLTAGEIVEQVVLINHWLLEKEERASHVVFMGMGEPMKNYDAVVAAIGRLTDPQMLNISQRRITVSTVGVVEGIRQLAYAGTKVNLVLSLHAPNQHIRKKIIPYARLYPLEEVMSAMDTYAEQTGRDVTYEYTLLAGINDGIEHAEELSLLLRDRQCTVNLIPYNPVAGLQLKRPETKVIQNFRGILHKARIPHTCRYTKGDDIAAACGQLAMQHTPELTVVGISKGLVEEKL